MEPTGEPQPPDIVIAGRLARHSHFKDRLVKTLFVLWLILMAVAIVVNQQWLRGPVPWWRDVLFFTLVPCGAIGLLFGLFLLISRLHARLVGLVCPSCRKTFTETQVLAVVLNNQCPLCSAEIDPGPYIR